MKRQEAAVGLEDDPFGLGDFDINAAFQEAVAGVASDDELALDEKVQRIEFIIQEGSSELYRDFVDFRALASEINMRCDHDEALAHGLRDSEYVNSFMDGNSNGGHDDSNHHHHAHHQEHDIDPITGKRRKKSKRRGWFSMLMDNA